MTKTETTTTCDFCGCVLNNDPLDLKTRLGLGVRLKVQRWLVGKWERYDLCDKCYYRMVKFCKEGAKEVGDGED